MRLIKDPVLGTARAPRVPSETTEALSDAGNGGLIVASSADSASDEAKLRRESPTYFVGAQRTDVPVRTFRRVDLSPSSSGVPSNGYSFVPRLYPQLSVR